MAFMGETQITASRATTIDSGSRLELEEEEPSSSVCIVY